jgi:glycosyltransferase involved in cell wall biosynthesis
MKAKISIIIPVYNVAKQLSRCLDSVLAQTFANFEIICINDGSTDKSPSILDSYQKKDKRIKVINQQNQGQAVARNNGLKLATTEYIYFLDGDDFIHHQLLEIAFYFLTKHNAAWLTFKSNKAFHKNPQLQNDVNFLQTIKPYQNIAKIPFKTTNNPLFLFKKNFKYKMTYYVWARVYKKELLKNISFLPNNIFEDDPFIIAVCSKNPKTILLQEELYYYTDNQAGVSNRTKAKLLPKHISDYHTGLVYMWEKYKKSPFSEKDFLAKEVVMRRLRLQYKKIAKAKMFNNLQIMQTFAKELIDLQKKGLIKTNLNLRNIFYYLKFKAIIKKYQKKYEAKNA